MVEVLKTHLHPCTLQNFLFPFNNERKEENWNVLCGCYELDEQTQQRNGKLLLVNVSSNDTLRLEQEYDCSSGILDLITIDNYIYLGLSSSTLEIKQFLEDRTLRTIASNCKSSEGLYLSINADRTSDASNRRIVCSSQSGSILIYQLSSGGLVEENSIENAHQLFGENMPVWIANINPNNLNQICSGGDDMQFKIWDIRSSVTSPQSSSKFHQAGVTSLEWLPENEHFFISGSYDESCAIWDLRTLKRPLIEVASGGGAWRVKRLNSVNLSAGKGDLFISISNMQKGSSIYHLNLQSLETLGEYCFHDGSNNHLNYAADLVSSTIEEGRITFKMISCSFYDNCINTWSTSFPHQNR